jgi:FAD-dependent urate hydroxylase
MTVRKTLVIGGGIGGPVAAMALQRAGIQATVYEATEVPADYAGLFLNTSSNGLDVLRTLGIDVTRRADGFPMPQMVMWSGTGKRLGEVANGVRLPDGTVSVAVKRGLLQRVLRQEAERRGVRFEFGKRLDTYQVGGGEVVARFTDGTQAEGDLLLGADGIHSATRQVMTQPRPRPPTPGYCRLAATATAPPSRRHPTPSTSSSAGGRSSATWCATAARSGGSPTSRDPRSRPGRSLPAPPPWSGSSGC